MALITQPPILIDGTNFSRQSSFISHKFLFTRGSDVYALLASQLVSATTMYKSTDEGQTWTLLDAANSPTPGGVIATYDDTTNNLISMTLYRGTSLVIVDFDPATDTWGTVSNSFSFGGNNWFPFALYRNLAGTPTILMSQPGASFWAITYTAGAWSAPGSSIFTAPASATFGNGIRDSVGTYHLSFNTSTTIYYVQVSNSLVASAAVLITTAFGGIFLGRMVVDGSTIRGVSAYEPSAGIYAVRAWSGTPLASPAFTTYAVSTGGAGEQFTYPDTVLDKDGNWVVVWTLTSSSLDQEMMSTFDGVSAFGAPVVFYDAVANPPPNVDAGSNFIHTVDLTQYSDGVWLMLTAMETTDLGGSCTGFALSSAAPSLSIACPIDSSTAEVGVLFTSSAPVVTGDTPPDTFVLLSGPAWMSIDAATGIVSGIPDATGSITYTIQVTDDLGNIATTDPGCDLTVSPEPIVIACPTTPTVASQGVPFTSAAPIVTDGTPPYTFMLISGPGWLSINATTGVVSGTPPVSGVFSYVIEVTDAFDQTADTSSCPLTTRCPATFLPGRGGNRFGG